MVTREGRRPPAAAPDAATIVLARDTAAGPEILLLERHHRSRMAPGAFAFPGGRVERADAPADAAGLCAGLTPAAASAILRDVTPPDRAIGFWIAALRELFEETGLLLAYGADGAPVVPDEVTRRQRPEYRRRSRENVAAFQAMLRAEGLRLATDRMAYWAHWITPEERPVRYDTRFFVAAAPSDAAPDPDGTEVVGFRWLTPAAAIARSRAGELSIPRVTAEILGSVARFPTVAAVLAAAATRDIRPVRPRVVVENGLERILLPDEPGWF